LPSITTPAAKVSVWSTATAAPLFTVCGEACSAAGQITCIVESKAFNTKGEVKNQLRQLKHFRFQVIFKPLSWRFENFRLSLLAAAKALGESGRKSVAFEV
jgi:hypothetical protein